MTRADPASISDHELLSLISDGHEEALGDLYRRHVGWLTLRLDRRCRDKALVDEVIQDTFMGVWRNARQFRGDGAIAAWIWGIGVRRLVDRLRRTPRLIEIDDAMDAEPSAEDLALQGVEHGGMAAALRALSPELQAVLRATVLDGLTTRQASVMLGIPQGTVKSRLVRARRQLREALA